MRFTQVWRSWLATLLERRAGGKRPVSSRFRSDFDVCCYVQEELTRGLPADWNFHQRGSLMEWRIEMRRHSINSLEDDYILEVSGDRRFFILYYGNAPSGGFGIHHVLYTAMVVTAERLSSISLSECIRHLLANRQRYPMNTWTLT